MNLSELGKAAGIPELTAQRAYEELKFKMLLALRRKNPVSDFDYDMNKRVAEVYQTWTGNKFNAKINDKNGNPPIFLMGPPGQGKTAVHMAAGKEVAEAMGLNFISNVTANYVPSRDDYVMVVHETAGETSALTFAGVPNVVEQEYTNESGEVILEVSLKKALNYRFTVLNKVAGGCVLFDDAANSSIQVQNVLLPVFQFGTFHDLVLPNCYIGATGNLGALDGTYTNELSKALVTRCEVYYVTDNYKDFVDRVLTNYNDEAGDYGYSNYILRNPLKFATVGEPGQKTGHPCSRTHVMAIEKIRTLVERHGGRGIGEAKCMSSIAVSLKAILGIEEGTNISGYIYNYFQGADPLAKKFIIENNPDLETFEEKQKGSSDLALSFGFDFASAIGDYTVMYIQSEMEKLKEGLAKEQYATECKKILEEGIDRFTNAAVLLDDSTFSRAVEHVKVKIATIIPEFAVTTANSNKKRKLHPEVATSIALQIVDHDDIDQAKRDVVTATLSDITKNPGYNKLKQKIRKGRSMMDKAD